VGDLPPGSDHVIRLFTRESTRTDNATKFAEENSIFSKTHIVESILSFFQCQNENKCSSRRGICRTSVPSEKILHCANVRFSAHASAKTCTEATSEALQAVKVICGINKIYCRCIIWRKVKLSTSHSIQYMSSF